MGDIWYVSVLVMLMTYYLWVNNYDNRVIDNTSRGWELGANLPIIPWYTKYYAKNCLHSLGEKTVHIPSVQVKIGTYVIFLFLTHSTYLY